jgi:hypothetical protein
VEVGFDTCTLHDQVLGHPRHIVLSHRILQLITLG